MNKKNPVLFIIISIIALFIFGYLSIVLGYLDTSFSTIYGALTNFDNSQEQIIILYSRIPRTLNAVVTGASLGVSGLMLQALTKNQLASASILGINSGASFLLVLVLFIYPAASWTALYWSAFFGALGASFFVYVLAGGLRGDIASQDLILGGSAISALLFSLTQGFLYQNNAALEDVLYWMTGSVVGKDMDIILKITPIVLIGLVVTLFMGKGLNIFALGDEMASSLGMNILFFKIFIILIVSVLCAASVALAGPVAFVGLVTPYIVKHFLQLDYKILIPSSAIMGALLLVASDILSRFLLYPKEIPVGAVTALIGGAFFVYLFTKGENHATNV